MTSVCYFGYYDANYSRNRILIRGLRENGIEVIECNDVSRGILKYLKLISKYFKIRNKCDVIVVGFPGSWAVVLAKILSRKPIIHDKFVSLYVGAILDRKAYSPKSWQAGFYWLLDWLSCKVADIVLLDTNEHINYFVKEFKIDKRKFRRIFIGADDEVIPLVTRKSDPDYFVVHFHGTYLPHQGVEYIAQAAKLLEKENIRFNLIGRRRIPDPNLHNLRFIDPVPYTKLKDCMADADICLGIFGQNEKARLIISNKVYEALAAGCPIITRESTAVKELLTDRDNVLFCEMANPRDLADKILELKNNVQLREKIAKNGHQLFLNKLRPVILGHQLTQIIYGLK